MSDYQRDVYYLYNYENGQKRNNVGFTRVEQFHGKCRMTSRIRVPSMNGKTLQVCLFIRKEGEMQFLPVGSMQINNMTGENRTVFHADNILGMGYCMEEMKGMVIYDSQQKFFGSEWDDQKIFFREFKMAEEKEIKQEEPEAEPDRLWTASCEEVIQETDKEKEEAVLSASREEELFSGVSEEIQEAECKNAENKEEDFSKGQFSESLPGVFFQFPQVHPFEDDEMTDCVRIEPQDIGRLPMESWVLANNSFLLHSYYSYRHLLLARKNSDCGYEYVLCAPGICQNREQFMAAMFGFCDFKPAKKVKDKNGEFGYWYMPVAIEA